MRSPLLTGCQVLSRSIDDIDSSCRPQTHAVLLEIIQAILERDTALPLMSIVSLPACVDNSLVVLARWGVTLPWAWVTWEDVRIYHSEVVEHLVSHIHTDVCASRRLTYLDCDMAIHPRYAC